MLSEMKEVFKQIMESGPVQEIGAELGRLGVQGQAEAANALFNGSAFVPYGEGQRGVEPEVQQAAPEVQQEMERGGR